MQQSSTLCVAPSLLIEKVKGVLLTASIRRARELVIQMFAPLSIRDPSGVKMRRTKWQSLKPNTRGCPHICVMLSRTAGRRPIANAIVEVMLEWKSRWVSGKVRMDEGEGG